MKMCKCKNAFLPHHCHMWLTAAETVSNTACLPHVVHPNAQPTMFIIWPAFSIPMAWLCWSLFNRGTLLQKICFDFLKDKTLEILSQKKNCRVIHVMLKAAI